jgi:hypothetical protein
MINAAKCVLIDELTDYHGIIADPERVVMLVLKAAMGDQFVME